MLGDFAILTLCSLIELNDKKNNKIAIHKFRRFDFFDGHYQCDGFVPGSQ